MENEEKKRSNLKFNSKIINIFLYAILFLTLCFVYATSVNKNFTTQVESIETEQSSINERYALLKDSYSKLNAKLEQVEKNYISLKEKYATINKMLHSNEVKDSWQISEALYLVKMAKVKVMFNDYDTAKILLVNSLEILTDKEHQEIVSLLKRDIDTISNFEFKDEAAVLLKLDDAISTVKMYSSSIIEVIRKCNKNAKLPIKGSDASYTDYLSNAWGEVKSLVKIRSYPVEDYPKILDIEDSKTHLNIVYFYLEQARWSLSHKSYKNFNSSINAAKLYLEKFIILDTKQQADLLQSITSLSNIGFINPNLVIDETLIKLDEVLHRI